MPTTAQPAPALPADDPTIFDLDLRGLRRRWADRSALPPISAEAMTGADRRAQALGVPEERLMEHAGTAVAAAVKALAVDLDRWGTGPIVILCGPGNNGGDGLVAARRLALAGAQVIVALVGSDARPRGVTSARNWDRIARDAGITKLHLAVVRDVAMFGPASTGRRSSSTPCSGPVSAGHSASRSAPRSSWRSTRPRPASRSSRSTPRRPSISRAASRPSRRCGPISPSPSTARRPACSPGVGRRRPARSWSRPSGSRWTPTVV